MRFILLFCLPLFIWAQNATLYKIIDADTLVFKYENKQIICQLAFIDAPESEANNRAKTQAKQCNIQTSQIADAGKLATQYTIKSIALEKDYKLDFLSPIKDGWVRCVVHIPQGTHPQLHPTLNGVLLDQGYGVFHRADAPSKESKQMQERAELSQKEHRGLWKKSKKVMDCLKEFNQ